MSDARRRLRDFFQGTLGGTPDGLRDEALRMARESRRASDSTWVAGVVALGLSIVIVAALLLVRNSSVLTKQAPANGPVAASASRTATPSAASSARTTAAPSAPVAANALSVNPNQGRVGIVVTLTGNGCHNPRLRIVMIFHDIDPGHGAGGAKQLDIVPDSQDHFQTTFTVPTTLDNYQGRGAGPTRPGRYAFESVPPYCFATFTVTG